MTPQIVIAIGLLIVTGTYVWFSRRVGNYINVLTPFLIFEIPAHFVLELVYGSLFGRAGSDFAYFYCYVTYTLGIVATAVGYVATPARPLPLVISVPRLHVPGAPLLFLLVGAALYAPILLSNPGLIASPREIYANTRTGFGVNFFLSSFAVYVSYILLLFTRTRGFLHWLFFLACLLLLYLHGSKGHVLQIFLIALYHLVFVQRRSFNIRELALIASSGTAIVLTLFFLTSSPASRADMLVNVVSYSDYTRNTMMVIDDRDLAPQGGRLTAEETYYSLVPRALFPNKPTNFGALWLAQRYFPERFAANTGAPAFGLGVTYADFRHYAIIYWVLGSLLAGAVMRVLVTRLQIKPDAGTFTLLLVFLGVQLIPAGAAVPLPFYYLCAVLIRFIAHEPRPSSTRAPPPIDDQRRAAQVNS